MIDQANKLRSIVKTRSELEALSFEKKEMNARIITITSGKGGVGKTNFALNLAIELRKQQKRVTIIDADFGLANIEVLCGVIPRYNFGDVLNRNTTIKDALTNGPMDVKFISGGSGLGELANLSDEEQAVILNHLDVLDDVSDIILIDTGAGISKTVINFIKASNEAIIITTPEPTSITDAYAIIKTIKESKNNIPEFKIVVNRVDDYKEGLEIFEKLNKVSERFLDISLTHLGSIPYDNQLIKAVKRQQPVNIAFPNCEVAKAIENISLRVLNMNAKSVKSEDGMKSFIRRLTNIFSVS